MSCMKVPVAEIKGGKVESVFSAHAAILPNSICVLHGSAESISH